MYEWTDYCILFIFLKTVESFEIDQYKEDCIEVIKIKRAIYLNHVQKHSPMNTGFPYFFKARTVMPLSSQFSLFILTPSMYSFLIGLTVVLLTFF